MDHESRHLLLKPTLKNVEFFINTLLSKGVKLTYLNSTPLSETCSKIYYSHDTQYLYQVDGMGPIADSIINEVGKSVLPQIHHIKNVVIPTINEFSTNIRTQLEKLDDATLQSFNCEIIVNALPSFVLDGEFLNIVEELSQYKNSTHRYLSKLKFIPSDITEGHFKDYTLPYPAMKEGYLEWLGRRNISELMMTYLLHTHMVKNEEGVKNTLEDLSQGNKKKQYLAWLDSHSFNPYAYIDYLLMNFFTLYHYLLNPPDINIKDMVKSDLTFNTYCKILLGETSREILSSLKTIKNYHTTKTVIVGMDSDTKKIYVIKELYEEWVKEGGDADQLLGLFYSGSGERSLGGLKSASSKLKRAYEEFSISRHRIIKLRKSDHLKLVVFELVTDFFNTVKDPVLLDFLNNYSYKKSTIIKEIESYLLNENENDLNNPHHVSRDIISKIIYGHTPAYQFIMDMEDYHANEDSGASPETCSVVATIRYLCDFYLSQLAIRA